MPFIIENFGSYENYVDWNGSRTQRQFIIKLTNIESGDTEIIKNNPTGIKKFGYSLVREYPYHGMFEDYGISLKFEKKEGGGGSFIRSVYEDTGITSILLCDIYFINGLGDDFDLLYNYKFDYNSRSYKNEEFYSVCNLVNVGLSQGFLSRQNMSIDATSNKSIDDITIDNEALEDISFSPIDVYLFADTDKGSISFADTLLDGSDIFEIPYIGGIGDFAEIVNQTDGRVTFRAVTDGVLYNNSTEAATQVKLTLDNDLNLNTTAGESAIFTISLIFETYTAFDDIVDTDTIQTYVNDENENQVVKIPIDYTTPYLDVPVNGYAKLYIKVDYTIYEDRYTSITLQRTATAKYYRIFERNPGAEETDVECYSLENILKKSLRIITSKNDSYYSDYIPTSVASLTYFTSGFKLRQFPDKGMNFKFADLFKSISNGESLGLTYDLINNRIRIENLEYFYQDLLIADFGTVDNFISRPSKDYYGELVTGSNASGDYEKLKGVFAFNVQSTHSTKFETSDKTDLRIPFHIDSLPFEYARQEPYKSAGATDMKTDNEMFMIATSGGKARVNQSNPEGFEGIEQYYNIRFLYRQVIKYMSGILSGMFWKEKGTGTIDFRNNSKGINISYDPVDEPRVNLNDKLTQSVLNEPFFYPEEQEFEATATIEQQKAIRANPHGYYRCVDNTNTEHFGYFTIVDVVNMDYKVKVIGLTANINR